MRNRASDRALRLPAIRIRQGPRRYIYSFAVDGKELPKFTAVSRIRRPSGYELQGYQRPEVVAHVRQIRKYLESADPILPNSIVVAFDKRVIFHPSDVQPLGPSFATLGTLNIPLVDRRTRTELPGRIVDGQQRAAAIRDARLARFPISVTAFIANDEREQREQFILVNSTKPLPKGLIYELLPGTDALLPENLRRKRYAALLVVRLNHSEESPFYRLIQSPTNPDGVVKDNSVLRMLGNSLSEGVLHSYRDPYTGSGDTERILETLHIYWDAVREVFYDSWGLPPRSSRLMHGVGIISMGFLMDALADSLPISSFKRHALLPVLSAIARDCNWTSGYWQFPTGVRRWNELQNTAADIHLLSDFLLMRLRQLLKATTRRAVR